MNKKEWDLFARTGIVMAPVRPEFLKKWDDYLHRIWEESRRDWHGETPLGRMGWLDPCAKILDIGCGAGYAMKELQSKGKDVVGLDATGDNVRLAKERNGLDIVFADMHDLPFDDESFDGVLIWDTFEHAFAPMIVLWEIDRVLKPGGRVLMYIPPETWTEYRVHMLIPTHQQIHEMISKAGLKVSNIEPDGSNGMLLDIVK